MDNHHVASCGFGNQRFCTVIVDNINGRDFLVVGKRKCCCFAVVINRGGFKSDRALSGVSPIAWSIGFRSVEDTINLLGLFFFLSHKGCKSSLFCFLLWVAEFHKEICFLSRGNFSIFNDEFKLIRAL